MRTAVLDTRHVTTYEYGEPALRSQNILRVAPRETRWQRAIRSRVDVDPTPEGVGTHRDYFGNETHSFEINEPHARLVISASNSVELREPVLPDPAATAPWETVRGRCFPCQGPDAFEAAEYLYDSRRVTRGGRFGEYARTSFPAGRAVFDAALDLNRRIHREFQYDPGSTEVDTPVEDALRTRSGVCQDFAHVMIACLRSMGIPARYVSGYLRSNPKFVGVEASHAWVSFYCPDTGWIDLDPTNDVAPSLGHVTLAWGRDYADVPPGKGVTLGGGEQKISVGVGVTEREQPCE